MPSPQSNRTRKSKDVANKNRSRSKQDSKSLLNRLAANPLKTRESKKSDKKASQKRRPRFLSRWFLIVPAIFLIFATVTSLWYYEAAKIWYRETRQERVLRETLAGIQMYNIELQQELNSLETTAGIQEYASRELNFVIEGDNAIVVTRDGIPLAQPRTSREDAVVSIPENAQPFGAWTDFLDTLFGIE